MLSLGSALQELIFLLVLCKLYKKKYKSLIQKNWNGLVAEVLQKVSYALDFLRGLLLLTQTKVCIKIQSNLNSYAHKTRKIEYSIHNGPKLFELYLHQEVRGMTIVIIHSLAGESRERTEDFCDNCL